MFGAWEILNSAKLDFSKNIQPYKRINGLSKEECDCLENEIEFQI